ARERSYSRPDEQAHGMAFVAGIERATLTRRFAAAGVAPQIVVAAACRHLAVPAISYSRYEPAAWAHLVHVASNTARAAAEFLLQERGILPGVDARHSLLPIRIRPAQGYGRARGAG